MKKIFMKVSTALAAFVLAMNVSYTNVEAAGNNIHLGLIGDNSFKTTVSKAANKEYTVIGVNFFGKEKSFSEILGGNGNVIMKSSLSSNTVSITNSSTDPKDLNVKIKKYDKKTKKPTTLGKSEAKNAVRVGCGTGCKREAGNNDLKYTMTAEYKKPYSVYNNPGGDYSFKFEIGQY